MVFKKDSQGFSCESVTFMVNMNILDIVFPKVCVGCKREGKYICDKCQGKLVVPEQICPTCCKPSLDGWTHPRCCRWSGMERLIVGLPYRGMVQQCLKKVKYKSAWEIIKFLYGLCVFEGIGDGMITSVPMWRAKERMRGFNQAEIIGKLLATSYKVPYLVMLERVRKTKPMFGLTRKKRKENIEGAFLINPKFEILNPQQIPILKSEIRNKIIVLVDDVWTTGATMRECARVLKRGGVQEVWGITLAR